jgi:HD superfamily phosphohydrolase
VHYTNNKNKVINDPVYGLVHIQHDFIFDLIEHPYFQRLRRIKQLGLSGLVYPGALHTRFHHAIGAMSLTQQAIEVLRNKKVQISEQEAEAVCAAVLLHDLGHGPYSHTLEHTLIEGVQHEVITLVMMHRLNKEFNGRLDEAIQIFTDQHPKKFLHQLVSGQLDMDRMDYLRRDSFFTGVQEGVIGHDRIIQMLNVHRNELVIDEKGIYSVEKFLIARRLMYWQVYLHKTVLCAEEVLVRILKRAKYLSAQGEELFATPDLSYFLINTVDAESLSANEEVMERFCRLDDFDIFTSIKVWCNHPDKILSLLCKQLVERQLPKIEWSNQPVAQHIVDAHLEFVRMELSISKEEASYFVFADSVSNKAYSIDGFAINVLYRDGSIKDIREASDLENIQALTHAVRKYFLCYPKKI